MTRGVQLIRLTVLTMVIPGTAAQAVTPLTAISIPQTCGSITASPSNGARPSHAALVDSLREELGRIIWDAVKARYDGAGPIAASADSEVALDVRAFAQSDSDRAWAVASALTDLIRGAAVGYTDVHATVAARLYRSWGLPFEPAAGLLSDPKESARARALAAAALELHWQERRFQSLAAQSFCWLAVRANAIQKASHADTTARIDDLLDADETGLLDVLISSAMAGASPQPGGKASIWYERSLPVGPVTRELKRALALEGRAK